MPLSDRLGCTATTLCIYSSAHMYTAHSTYTVTRDPRVGWGLRVPTTPTAMMPLSDRCMALTLYIHTGSSTHDVYTLASLTHTHNTHTVTRDRIMIVGWGWATACPFQWLRSP